MTSIASLEESAPVALPRLPRTSCALVVAVPIAAFYGLCAAGLPVGTCEDLVTVLVMVPLGGPHVVATFGRTLFRLRFWREDPVVAVASVALLLAVVAIAVASAFFDVRIAGAPPIQYLLTGFFFWAGLHVLQQHCFVADRIDEERGGRRPPSLRRLGNVAMLTSLYPVSLFRMSMIGADAAGNTIADPQALATRIVRALGASDATADSFVFRIGRASPILPEFARHPAVWIGVAVVFAASFTAFAIGVLRERRRGRDLGPSVPLVVAVSLTSLVVPLLPNLDSAFQGINAWHAVQYLGLTWMLHERAVRAGRANDPWRLRGAKGTAGAYGVAVALTLALVAAMLLLAWSLVDASAGRFSFFGHDVEPDDSGSVPYRPGAVLTSYYLLGFGFLLVHYLQDTVDFVRRRDGRGRDRDGRDGAAETVRGDGPADMQAG